MSYDYEKQWPGLDVEHLVLSTKDFIVFVDSKLDVDWATSANYDEIGAKDLTAHNEILNKAAFLESLPSEKSCKKVKLHFKRMLGEGIVRSIKHDYVSAQRMLETAESFIQARNSELARAWYLIGSGLFTTSILVFGIFIWINRSDLINFIGQNLFILFIAATAGSVGAMLSVIMRMGSTSLDSAAGRNLHFLESISKIVAGMISAVLVALAVNAEILLPVFNKIDNKTTAIVLAALVAGASERLAPSIIQTIEEKAVLKKKKEKEKI